MARTATAHRARLVAELRRAGALRTPAVEAAFLSVPRERFVPEFAAQAGLDAVYRNEMIVTKADQRGVPLSSSSEPQVMAAMLERLDVRDGMRVLEIGAGSGYNAALLGRLVGPRGRVTTVDVDPSLAAKAADRLRADGAPVDVVCGDGRLGHGAGAPYDRIVVTASSDTIPRAWLAQLAEGGLLELPLQVSLAGAQAIVTFRRTGRCLESVSVVPGRFMPLRDDGRAPATPPVLTVAQRLRPGGETVLTRLAGSGVAAGSPAARERLAALSEPRSLPLGIRAASWSLGLYLSLELPAQRQVTRYADLAIGVVGRGWRSLALVPGRWEHGNRATAQTIVAYGAADAEERLAAALEEWRRRGRPGARDLRLSVDFRDGRSRFAREWTVRPEAPGLAVDPRE